MQASGLKQANDKDLSLECFRKIRYLSFTKT